MKYMMLFILLLSGCVSNNSILTSRNIEKGDKIIYFEQYDRVPKEIILSSITNNLSNVKSINIASIEKLLESITEIVPQTTEIVNDEKKNNILLQRRILIRGYSKEELKDIAKIIQEINNFLKETY